MRQEYPKGYVLHNQVLACFKGLTMKEDILEVITVVFTWLAGVAIVCAAATAFGVLAHILWICMMFGWNRI
jgi:hypothetical protein